MSPVPTCHKDRCTTGALPLAIPWTRLLATVGMTLAFAFSAGSAVAQSPEPTPKPASSLINADDHAWFPRSLEPFRAKTLPAPAAANSARLSENLRNGTLELSLDGLFQLLLENNLDFAAARYNLEMSETDLLRAKAGQAPRGTDGARVPSGLFAGAIGAGLGGSGGGGGGGGGGGISGNARAVNVGPRGSYDPSFTVSFSQDRTTSPLNSTRISGVPTVTTSTTAFSARYVQAFTSGTSFTLSYNAQRQKSTQQFLLFNPSVTSGLNFQMNQQLLAGWGFAINRRFEHVAERNRSIAREVFRQQLMTGMAQAENQYWDLAASRKRVESAGQALVVAERLLNDNRRQAEIGTLPPLDVVAAESEVAARRRDLIITQTSQQVAELRLKNLFGKSMTDENDAVNAARITLLDPLPEPQDSDIPALEDAVAAAMSSRPELAQGEGNILNQQVATGFTRRRLKPALNVFGVLSNGGRESSLGSALAQNARYDFPEYAFGFSLSFSTHNRAAQADDMRARLDLRQAETSLERTRNQIRLEVRNAIIGLMQTKAQVTAAERAVGLATQTLDAEEKKLRAGTSVSYNVIRIQRDVLNAQLAEVQARVNYAKARVELDRSTGKLLDRANISLESPSN